MKSLSGPMIGLYGGLALFVRANQAQAERILGLARRVFSMSREGIDREKMEDCISHDVNAVFSALHAEGTVFSKECKDELMRVLGNVIDLRPQEIPLALNIVNSLDMPWVDETFESFARRRLRFEVLEGTSHQVRDSVEVLSEHLFADLFSLFRHNAFHGDELVELVDHFFPEDVYKRRQVVQTGDQYAWHLSQGEKRHSVFLYVSEQKSGQHVLQVSVLTSDFKPL